MTNAADHRAVNQAKKKARFARRQELADLRDVLSTSGGRRFVWRQLTQAGVFRSTFVPGESDSSAFNEGRRAIGLSLMADIHELDPELYVMMAREANETTQQEQKVNESKEISTETKEDDTDE